MITIINYGLGNLGSLVNMYNRIGIKTIVSSDPLIIAKADKLLLPGVGSFDSAMNNINSISGLREILDRKALVEKIPILGVCLGMQIITRSSEEGIQKGLNWIPASTILFPKFDTIKNPHMGWNTIKIQKYINITKNIDINSKYYFVHSYYVKVDNPENSLMKTSYGICFDSAIHNDNIYGVQFHPEKSHRFGMEILKNFSLI